jgi:ParB family chromosome partitioning protein
MAVEGRRGLGRGLSALLGENEVSATLPEGAARGAGGQAWTLEVPIEFLRRNPDQPRKTFSDAELDELAASIREKGVIQPLLVRPTGVGGEYEIVAGERRWRAAQRAGLRELPVVIRTLADAEVLEIGIIENVQRVDLNPIEEAMGYKALMERFGRTQEMVAETVGKSRPHIANALRLLNLPGPVQAFVVNGQLSAGHARAIAAAADPLTLAREVVDKGLTVREAEALARASAGAAGRKPRAGSPGVRPKDADTRALESDLAEALGLQVEILDRNGSGEVRVKYATLEQLDEVCRRLGGG